MFEIFLPTTSPTFLGNGPPLVKLGSAKIFDPKIWSMLSLFIVDLNECDMRSKSRPPINLAVAIGLLSTVILQSISRSGSNFFREVSVLKITTHVPVDIKVKLLNPSDR